MKAFFNIKPSHSVQHTTFESWIIIPKLFRNCGAEPMVKKRFKRNTAEVISMNNNYSIGK